MRGILDRSVTSPGAEPRRVTTRSLRPNQGYRAEADRARLPSSYSYARWPWMLLQQRECEAIEPGKVLSQMLLSDA